MAERQPFDEQLDALNDRLVVMAGVANDQVRDAVAALIAGDRERIHRVLTGDGPIDALQAEIDERCVNLLALRQPVAVDLRYVIAAMKVAVDLERIGDLALSICDASDRYIAHRPVKPLIDLPRMAEIAQHMLTSAVQAFLVRSVPLAVSVLMEDDTLDELRHQVFRELLTYMLGNAMTIEPALDLLQISRHLERIGDHATNIAEDVIFIVDARDVRHVKRKNSSLPI